MLPFFDEMEGKKQKYRMEYPCFWDWKNKLRVLYLMRLI